MMLSTTGSIAVLKYILLKGCSPAADAAAGGRLGHSAGCGRGRVPMRGAASTSASRIELCSVFSPSQCFYPMMTVIGRVGSAVGACWVLRAWVGPRPRPPPAIPTHAIRTSHRANKFSHTPPT